LRLLVVRGACGTYTTDGYMVHIALLIVAEARMTQHDSGCRAE
jgi:hypothetical protein